MSVIAANTNVPVSVKCRIGVDDHDSYNELCKLFCQYYLFDRNQIRLLFLFFIFGTQERIVPTIVFSADCFIGCYILLSSSFFFSGDFIYKVSSLSPTRHFIIHSRKALLNGISPADNRRIPPLKYAFVELRFIDIKLFSYITC